MILLQSYVGINFLRIDSYFKEATKGIMSYQVNLKILSSGWPIGPALDMVAHPRNLPINPLPEG